MDPSQDGSLVVLVSAPSAEKAAVIARALVEERLAACVNVVPTVRSIYRWEGKVLEDGEALMIVKTRRERFDALRDRVLGLHEYSCPEIVALPIERGHEAYLRWLTESVSG